MAGLSRTSPERNANAAASIAVIAIIFIVWLTLDTDNTDFLQFWATAGALKHGGAAYPAFIAPNGQEIFNLNPPHFHLPLLLLLPLGIKFAHLVWVIAGLLALWWSERRAGVLPSRVSGLALFCLSVNAVTLSVLGTDAPVWLLTPLVVVAWQGDRRGDDRISGGVLGLLISLKLFLLAFVPWLIWRQRWRQLTWLAIGALVPFAIGMIVLGPAPYVEWAAALTRTSATASLKLNMSLPGVLARAGYGAPLWKAMVIAPVALLAAWRLTRAGVDEGWTIVLLGALLCSPLGWTYYAVWLWPVWAGWRHTVIERAALAFWLIPPQLVISSHWVWGSPYTAGLLLLFVAHAVRPQLQSRIGSITTRELSLETT